VVISSRFGKLEGPILRFFLCLFLVGLPLVGGLVVERVVRVWFREQALDGE
jgi:hypothetical protein